jgi:Fe-S-cluster containining protein
MHTCRLNALRAVYDLYAAFSSRLPMACKRGCALCCTQHVTMTTLEGRLIIEDLAGTVRKGRHAAAPAASQTNRDNPPMTTNAFALFCFQGQDPSAHQNEQNPRAGMPCRFLSDDECTIYDARPFGCRCFFSTQLCEKEGCAVIEPFLLTVNTVFLQFIEHMDQDGFFGNLDDVLAFLTSDKQPGAQAGMTGRRRLSSNQPIPVLLIPPEHRQRMEPIVQDLKELVS